VKGKCPTADWLPNEAQEDAFVGRKALQLLRRRPRDKPFFLQVNFPSPHDPYVINACMAASIAKRPIGKSSTGDASEQRRGYAALCEVVDVWLGRLIDELERERAALSGGGEASVLDVTLVCYSSDHGDMLGDGGQLGKQVAGQGSVAVPLACRGPKALALGDGSSGGGPAETNGLLGSAGGAQRWVEGGHAFVLSGAVVTQPVSILDLAATFIEVGAAVKPKSMSSRSLLPVLLGHKSPRDVRSVVTAALKDWRVAVRSVRASGKHWAQLAAPALMMAPSGENATNASAGSNVSASLSGNLAPTWVTARVNFGGRKGASVPDCGSWTILNPTTNYVPKAPYPADSQVCEQLNVKLDVHQAFGL
jgi:hypothetical protein